ncbi:plasmid stabilization system [Stanieria cyanosphaera PCC 7437]|uniref:Plasmid stabilization system n=1 Tax=Stanieria cyanosphaera (strain ATCC 29371 / PCC 7437) TaxID=111780 RepID=K9XPD2_STAC7|nr:type II toxin-antitoxin system RelE/ParE family toxin [Stanieria cyanosphaera]AFZ34388.1 plasmid stabilization system [Stanieria cyanosphaera PCC 7437]
MTTEKEYEIRLTSLAVEMLAEIKDRRHLKTIGERIEKLKINPELQGKALTNKLKGYRSIRAVSQRYRIIYQIERDRVIVFIVGVGLRAEGNRQDIYTQIENLLED